MLRLGAHSVVALVMKRTLVLFTLALACRDYMPVADRARHSLDPQPGHEQTNDGAGSPPRASDRAPRAGVELAKDHGVHLRLRNVSEVDFDSIEVQWKSDPIHFGALPARAQSQYRDVRGAYAYGYIRATNGKTVFIALPVDYIGESTLGAGYYTYVLTAKAPGEPHSSGDLDVKLFRDLAPN
jgi:hypothetical protein